MILQSICNFVHWGGIWGNKKEYKKSFSSETYVWGKFVSNVNKILLINELYISFGDCYSVAVICMSLQSHGLQHARLPCPSLTLEFAQIHVLWVSDAIQPSHPLPPTFPPALNLSQHQHLFQWGSSLHQVAKVLEFFSISPPNDYLGLISFRIDWFKCHAVQETLKGLLQHHNLKTSIHQPSLWSDSYVHAWLLEKP